jgi:glutathione S-transferase
MKLYDHALAPNPRRVRIFAAEKGLAEGFDTRDLKKAKVLHHELAA